MDNCESIIALRQRVADADPATHTNAEHFIAEMTRRMDRSGQGVTPDQTQEA